MVKVMTTVDRGEGLTYYDADASEWFEKPEPEEDPTEIEHVDWAPKNLTLGREV